MLDIIETILVKVFSLLPDADPNNTVIASVNSAFNTVTPTFAKLNLIFPVYTLFKILLMVLFVELSIFLITLVLKMVSSFKP